MKKIFIAFFLLLFLSLFFYFVERTSGSYLPSPQFFTDRFSMKTYEYPVVEQKPFVFLVYANNAIDNCEKNLSSIFEQEYTNFRVIYIDDSSNDGTTTFVKDFSKKNGKEKQIQIIRNDKKRGMLASLFDAIHCCQNNEIVLLVEGKDWLAHNGVLAVLNKTYANPNVWMTYGQYISYPSYQMGICEPFSLSCIEKYGFRGHAWVASHLQTFYAGLFKNIWLEDLVYENKWIDRCVEMAMMFPLLEMAKESHYVFLSDVLYVCNEETISPKGHLDSIAQNTMESFLRNMCPIQPLNMLGKQQNSLLLTDIVIFSLDRCMQLYACLESIEQYVTGVNKIFVIYRSTSEKYQKSYEILEKRFPNILFIPQKENPYENFKPLLLENVFTHSKARYVMFGVDSSLVKDKIDLSFCMEMMEKTHAYGFFFRLGHGDLQWDAPDCISLNDHVYAWQISRGEKEWSFAHDLHLTLYRKDLIYKDFIEMSFKDPNQLRRSWSMRENDDPGLIGLCFDKTKTIHLSGYRNKAFLSPDEFEALFEEGLKINTKRIAQTNNHTSHIDCEMEFVKR